ncbi:hypothetical protein NDU88_011088 [Pleurodeles waltl]|uniref:Uncharacterized protein n=1 Tax=Pleurodeles waltl TaxID=8319 RepID=A0AAV7R246_PLEWA|nr:hypothetical protein NDU88_011088 [Pleurodeles waltl]
MAWPSCKWPSLCEALPPCAERRQAVTETGGTAGSLEGAAASARIMEVALGLALTSLRTRGSGLGSRSSCSRWCGVVPPPPPLLTWLLALRLPGGAAGAIDGGCPEGRSRRVSRHTGPSGASVGVPEA